MPSIKLLLIRAAKEEREAILRIAKDVFGDSGAKGTMMKLNDCLCRRYSLANETGWEVKEKLIGFEILPRAKLLLHSRPFGLVEIPGHC